MPVSEKIYQIILDSLARCADKADGDFLAAWLDESQENRELYREISGLWYGGKWSHAMGRISKEMAWSIIYRKRRQMRHRQQVRTLYKTVSAIAASIILIIGSAWFFRSSDESLKENTTEIAVAIQSKAVLILSSGEQIDLGEGKQELREQGGTRIQTDSTGISYGASVVGKSVREVVYNELVIPKCGEYHLQLADGTTVFMNSESRLRFPVEFTADCREVFLEGEAYFEVAKDAAKPFIVHTAKTAVRVFGTEFNVMAYKDEKNTEITLVCGSVRVDISEKSQMLEPGRQVVVDNTTLRSSQREVNIEQYTAWKKGLFCFDAMPLEQLMKGLQRWYDVSYRFNSESVRKLRFSGAFLKTSSIQEIFGMIEKMTDVEFDIENQVVVIKNK